MHVNLKRKTARGGFSLASQRGMTINRDCPRLYEQTVASQIRIQELSLTNS